jgi:hypothetical protein
MYVPGDADKATLEQMRRELETKMVEMKGEADDMVALEKERVEKETV